MAETVRAGLPFVVLIVPFMAAVWVGHPATFLKWVLEWLGRYFFGLSGMASVGQTLRECAKTAVMIFVTHACLESPFVPNFLITPIVFVVLAIPLRCLNPKVLPLFLIPLASSIIEALYGIGLDEVVIPSAIWFGLIDFMIPHCSAFSSWVILHWNPISPLPYLKQFRALGKYFFVPLISGALLKDGPSWLVSFLVVQLINCGIREGHVFALALLVYCGFSRSDFASCSGPLLLRVCLVLAHKISSVLPITDLWLRGRPLVCLPLAIGPRPSLWLDLFWTVVVRLPCPDRVFSFPTFLWSFLTGAPMINPFFEMWIMLPSPPRANSFWNTARRSLNLVSSLNTRFTAHALETPVYVSLQNRMERELAGIIQSGKLGIVDSNDIFLFASNDDMSAFVHVIGYNSDGLSFQIRGLEYKSETACHRSELSALRSHSCMSSPQEFQNMMRCHAECMSRCWSLRALDVHFATYAITIQDFPRLWWQVQADQLPVFGIVAFMQAASQRPDLLSQITQADTVDPDILAAGQSDFQFADLCRCQTLFTTVFAPLLPSRTTSDVCSPTLASLFNDRIPPQMLDEQFNDEEIVREIICPAVRKFILLAMLVSINPFARKHTVKKVLSNLTAAELEWTCATLQSHEFQQAMRTRSRHLVTVEEKTMRLVVFRATESVWSVFALQREVVRSFWATEAQAQIFWGERDPERMTIQANPLFLHNLIIQSADSPTGYPAVVSPVIESRGWPFNL